MNISFLSSTPERLAETQPYAPWIKKSTPPKNSTLFRKAKHSEEWHDKVEATASSLRPSDPMFPYSFLRNHTNVYLRRKKKINQAEADVRLATLVDTHNSRDIGIAAVAHAMSAKNLRDLLHVELNVEQGSYWGLETWLQCLIAAKSGNPASITDLEALWARVLLPYAVEGGCAARLYLKGVSRALRKPGTLNMEDLPEFSILLQRAILDYSEQLEGFRLSYQWAAAHEAVFWMIELERTTPTVSLSRKFLLGHIFDSQFPIWRLWAQWKPDIHRIVRISSIDSVKLATIPDIVALEGPDVLTGRQKSLKEGIIAQYSCERLWIKSGSLIVEVPDRTRDGLRTTLERLLKALASIMTEKLAESGRESMFGLFKTLILSEPVTKMGLDLFDATHRVPYTSKNDIYNVVLDIHTHRDNLDGQHIVSLHTLVSLFDKPEAGDLKKILLHPWLLRGIERCIRNCQIVVQEHIDGSLPWTHLASELHAFLTTIKRLKNGLSLISPDIISLIEYLPSSEQMMATFEIYSAAQSHRPKPPNTFLSQHAEVDGHENTDGSIDLIPQPFSLLGDLEKMRHPLETVIETFCVFRLLRPGQLDPIVQQHVNVILQIWESTTEPRIDQDLRSLAILTARSARNSTLRSRCLADIALRKKLLEPNTLIRHLVTIMEQEEVQPERAIIEFSRLLATNKAWEQCWKDLLYAWLGRETERRVFGSTTVLDYSLHSLKSIEWLSFMESLESIFVDLDLSISEERAMPLILQPRLLRWRAQVSRFTNTLTRLENALDDADAVRCILICGKGQWAQNLISILECLERAEGQPAELLMQKIVGKLSTKANNAWEVKDCLYNLLGATPDSIQACQKLWDAKHGFLHIPGLPIWSQVSERPVTLEGSASRKTQSFRTTPSTKQSFADQQFYHTHLLDATQIPETGANIPSSVAEIMVAGWMQDDSVDVLNRIAIESIACLLQLEIYRDTIPVDKLLEVTVFWEGIEKEIVAEADRLEVLKRVLNSKDPKGTTVLLQELDIPEYSLLEEELAALPADVNDVVEQVGDNEVEISFSLAAYTELDRSAMGIPKRANNLLLRLFIDHHGDIPPSFCLHFNSELDLERTEHSSRICSQDSGSPQTAFIWQMNLVMHTQLRIGNIRIEDLHRLVKKKMQELGHSCICCGASHNARNAQLRRSTPCDVTSCLHLWSQLPLDIRVPEIRMDTFAVDMILTSVYAAAISNKPELLPGCPINGSEMVKTILNSLPNLTVLSHAVNLSAVLKSYHKDAEKLISWACVHFRGYLATAAGICKIPKLPVGIHQFVLVSASPKLETDFISRLPKYEPKTIVLFHGTSLDRLPAILAQGLKICSGTSLQRTGAAYGKGIYMAEDPATSFTYSSACLSWRNSRLPNMRLMLGCEVAGIGRSVSSGIHLITDEKSVIVRDSEWDEGSKN